MVTPLLNCTCMTAAVNTVNVSQLCEFNTADRMPTFILFHATNCFRFKPEAVAESYVPLHYIVTYLSLLTLQGSVHTYSSMK